MIHFNKKKSIKNWNNFEVKDATLVSKEKFSKKDIKIK